MIQCLIPTLLIVTIMLVSTLAAGAVYEVFIRRKPKIELSRDRKRRVRWLLHELDKELGDHEK